MSRRPSSSSKPVYPVYVGHIPTAATVADLRGLFTRSGRVLEVTIVAEHGFVNFSSDAEAVEAIERYNGHLMFGQPLHVDYSEELAAHLRSRGRKVEFTEDPMNEKRVTKRLPAPVASRRSPPSPKRARRSSSSSRPSGRGSPPPSHRRSSPRRSPLRRTPSRRSPSRRSSPPPPLPSRRTTRSPPSEDAPGGKKMQLELSEDKKVDLRTILCSRKTTSSGNGDSNSSREVKTSLVKHIGNNKPSIKIKIHAKDDEREVQVEKESVAVDASHCQELYVGNLFNEVEKSDLERLLESHGKVVKVELRDTYAIVQLDCSPEAAEAAIAALDRNLWMDNNIRVKFSLRRPRPPTNSSSGHCDRTKKEEDEEPSKPLQRQQKVVDSAMIDNFLRRQRLGDKGGDNNRTKVRTLVVYSPTMPKSFMTDMTEVFSRFGVVDSCQHNPDGGKTLCVGLLSSERQAINCMVETNKVRYKGVKLRVKFLEGTKEDSIEFRRRHPIEFRDYPEVLVKTTPNASNVSNNAGGGAEALPIGVLPPSSSLGAFGATPAGYGGAMTTLIQNARAKLAPPRPPPQVMAPQQLREDPEYASSVEGEIHSIHNKIVIVNFYTGYSFKFAKFVPGQMYVNGKRSLGYVIKNNTFHTWPAAIKSFLYQGARVKMDVRKMSELEIADTQEITSEYVMYSTPLVWRGQKPEEVDLVVTAANLRKRVLKGVVKKLFPKWGVLTCESEAGFFEVQHYFDKTGTLSREDSLLNHLTVGDILAVHCVKMDYLEMAETARQAPGFACGTDDLRYHARLVWQISAEVDPHAHKDALAEEEECKFLNTSSTLNSQLPAERDATHRSWPGIIEEIHLPAGGVVLLDESLGMMEQQRRVYFHRSRVFLNGAKVTTNSSLDEELALGDPVTVDVILNQDPTNPHSPPYVFTAGAFWVAVALQLGTRDRGARIAGILRAIQEEGNVVGNEEQQNVAKGRIIHFRRPSEAATGPVVAGTAVIDTGPFAGQRVDFERKQCQAFGFSLAKADLAQIFKFGEPVFIQVKPYNSFCVENLFVGFKTSSYREAGLTAEERLRMKAYLIAKGLDFTAFDHLVNGKYPSRPFIPLPAHAYKGRIRGLKSTLADRSANVVTVDADLGGGEVIRLEARREEIFVYGHWMGKADLRYILEDEKVCIEYAPQLDRDDDGGGLAVSPRASMMWLGDEDDRPFYNGQSNRAHISAKMDSALWKFVRTKKMDEKMFRALVEGRLPPKEPEISLTAPDGSTISLDRETLAQAALLKQMKSSFGPTACLKAMMMLMAGGDGNAEASTSSTEMGLTEMQKMLTEAMAKNKDEKAEPTGKYRSSQEGPFDTMYDYDEEEDSAPSTSAGNQKRH